MLRQKLDTKKLIFNISLALLSLIVFFAIYMLVTGRLTLGAYNKTWDGVSVALNFETGNGNYDNPYVIKTEEEFIYFKKLIESDEYLNYQNKYYVLGNDLDFGNNSISSIGISVSGDERVFKGHLDGAGYSLNNLNVSSSLFGDTSYYGLFAKTVNATVENLNINNLTIEPKEENGKVVIGTLVGDSSVYQESDDSEPSELSSFKNISISDFSIKLSDKMTGSVNATGFINNISKNTVINNIYLKGSITGNRDSDLLANVSIKSLSDTSNIICDVLSSTDKLYLEKVDGVLFENNYVKKDGKFYLDNSEVSFDEILNKFNTTDDYYWDFIDGVFVFKKKEKIVPKNDSTSKSFSFSMSRSGNIPVHASGLGTTADDRDTIYINDLDSDYNYYSGLNYIDYRDINSLPETVGVNRNLYNNGNLVKVYIKYDGTDLNDSNLVGTVSTTERISKFIYYKYFVIENGYVNLELIDNPYANRPNDSYFQGWATDYPGVVISHNSDEYLRYAKIPVIAGTSEISITFNAIWGQGNTYILNQNPDWSDISDNLDEAGIVSVAEKTYEPALDSVYISETVAYRGYYPDGAKSTTNGNLSGRCTSWRGCSYYILNGNKKYSSSETYYELLNNRFYEVKLKETIANNFPQGYNMAGYFRKMHFNSNQNVSGYYDGSGNIQSGSCSSYSGCDYYKLLQYYDEDGNVNLSSENEELYRLVTRDTNIVVLTENINNYYAENVTPSVPLTLTGINNGNFYDTSYSLQSAYVKPTADLRIEYITMNSTTTEYTNQENIPLGAASSQKIYGNWHNLKIGRGMKHTGNYFTAGVILAGSNSTTGSSSNITKYRTIVESGYYNFGTLSNSGTSRYSSISGNSYVDGTMVWGCDYDRITDETTDNLAVSFAFSGTWSGNIRTVDDGVAFHTIIKSGRYGTGRHDYTTGVYVSGRNYGKMEAASEIIVEGGWIYNLIGGPASYENRSTKNEVYINMKGGQVDYIFGGAGLSETYGNRIISVTGGQVNYSVFGGSNGSSSTNGGADGKIKGSSLIYIGGNAIIGDANLVSSGTSIFGAEAGSVFGIGNGKSNNESIGSMKESHIIIDGGAQVKRNVYGGGNYGYVGHSSFSTTLSKIDIIGGTVDGAVYGGGNNNGSGTSSISSEVQINMTGGQVGYVYGGSRSKGTVYGSTTVNVTKGRVLHDVYGGGEGGYTDSTRPGTYIRNNVSVVIGNTNALNTDLKIDGNVYGGSAFGSVNTTNQTATTSSSTTKVTVNSGVVSKSVFGGAKGDNSFTPKVVGDIEVNIKGGSIGNVFGGMDASGKLSNGDIVYLNGGVIGNAYGGGNNASQDVTNIFLQGSAVNELFGGSNLLGTVNESNVKFTSGDVNNIYGGNNKAGSTVNTNVTVQRVTTNILGTGAATEGIIAGDIYGGGNEAESTNSNVLIEDSTVNDVYGGGNKAGLTKSLINLNVVSANNIFGGSNVSGNIQTTNVNVKANKIGSVYGGNNKGGESSVTNVDIASGEIGNVYGGGDSTKSGVSNVTINDGKITNVYGGGNGGVDESGTPLPAGVSTSNVDIYGGEVVNAFGGSNTSGDLDTSNVYVGGKRPIELKIDYSKRAPGYYPSSTKPTYAQVSVEVINKTDVEISDWNVVLNVPKSEIFKNDSYSNIDIDEDTFIVNSINKYYGNNTLPVGGSYTFDFEILSDTALADFDVTGSVETSYSTSCSANVNTVYGGNNKGGVTSVANVLANSGVIGSIYGGGNEAVVGKTNVDVNKAMVTDIYGGGNAAGIRHGTFLNIDNATIKGNVFGGGNEGIVEDSTEVFVTDASIDGNVYAGGNGATAVVYKNSSIIIDGKTIIGTEDSEAPNTGCVFGSGNAAATGLEENDDSNASVKIVGGYIYGNVYGGAKMSFVYGTTEIDIGTNAVNLKKITEDGITIKGTVFGGGESNANGDEHFDWDFIAVTQGINVNINGNGYIDRGHDFVINGSIFGSGNASSSAGDSIVSIKDLGTKAKPNRAISIQRATKLVIDNSVIELEGAFDRTNDYGDAYYSFNIIDLLIIKNNTTLLLKNNANLLKEIYSGVDKDGKLVPAVVEIDDDSKKVTKNVDNRIYMAPNQNLNVAINSKATVYGVITGMTFFGMYNSYSGGSYRFGLYDNNVNYGDAGDAAMSIIGGSYVLGLHKENHDITKDGFYSNYLSDDYSEVSTKYIDPTTVGETGYRWLVGKSAITYSFTLTASKYSSFGTKELQFIEEILSKGDVKFSVLGFNSEGLGEGVNLIDPARVPRIGKTEEDANSILGLAMKVETQEWTSHGSTSLISEGTGKVDGDLEYKTDSRSLPPSLMFYLYHAKNITAKGPLGTVVIMLQAEIPKTEYDYDIELITITIDLLAAQYDDPDSYDASITYDKRYEMPSTTTVNITNQSQFSAYYSLMVWSDSFEKIYGKDNTNFHVLTTNNPLPVGTMITMIDYSGNEKRPEYYYFTITEDVYNDSLIEFERYNEVSYRLSNFIKMGSTSTDNTYDDKVANKKYYSEDIGIVDEEFMFIFDLKDSTQTGTHLNNSMLFELRNSKNEEVLKVLGIRQQEMVYSTFGSSNAKLTQTITDADEYVYHDILSDTTYTTEIKYDQTQNNESVIDTNYESSSMGINVALYDQDEKIVSSSLLTGTSITIDGNEYFADSDGIFRIKLAGKVSNIKKKISLLTNKDLPPGPYTLRYTLFASDDGLHNSNIQNSVSEDLRIMVVGSDNSIVVNADYNTMIVNGETSLNLQKEIYNSYNVKYSSVLNNPNIRLELFKRDISAIDSASFESVPFSSLFRNALPSYGGNEMRLDMNGLEERKFNFYLKDKPESGTYKLVFRLYDKDQLVDDDIKYVIVKKKTE